MIRHAIAMLQMLLEAQNSDIGVPDGDLCIVGDTRLGECTDAADDHAFRLRAVRGASSQIARQWPLITTWNSVPAR
jgi:hypothetical protein